MKTNLNMYNNRYRGPIESSKLIKTSNILNKNFEDIKKHINDIKEEVLRIKEQSSTIYKKININKE